jgi:hypothetical protein
MKKNLLNEINEIKRLFDHKRGVVISEQPEIMEPDTETETKPRTRPGRPDSDPFPNPFNPDRAKEFNPLPDLEPQGRMGDNENEPFINDVDTDYSESRSLEDLVAKYLNRRQNNN